MSNDAEHASIEPLGQTQATDYAKLYQDAQAETQPTPATKKAMPIRRFELASQDAPEGAARERLHALREVITAIQVQLPEVLGATIFGSTVKGRMKPESDIDGFLFVDADRAAEAGRPLITEEKDLGTYIRPLTSTYRAEVINGMREHGFTDPGLLSDFTELPISTEIITNSVEKLAPQAEALGAFRERVLSLEPEAKEAQVAAINDLSNLNTRNRQANMPEAERQQAATAFIEALPASIDRDLLHYPGLTIPRNIRGLFHLGINNQPLRAYRSLAINELAAHGKAGEVIWTELTKYVLYFEEGRRGATVHFPRTLTEAAEMYAD